MKKGKVIMITGASKGFGFEMVRAALANNDRVIATVRKEPEKLYQSFDYNPDLFIVTMDVTREDTVKTAVQSALGRFGTIDTLINNAGYGLIGAVEEASDAEVRKQYDTNVFGLINVIRAVLPVMRQNKSGHIINISSLFGYDAVAGWTIYSSTKFAVEGISTGLAKELSPLGIRVTALAPGLFSTDFLGKSSFSESKRIIPEYAETVGQVRQRISGHHGNQPGDPRKLAELAISITHIDEPPLHLLAGKDAIDWVQNAAAKTADEIEKWRDISSSMNHDL
ncbi:oxidoreductase [Mucilaginibacter psychrotolerans]|uniref:SDR family NAD(P)-dependent oxidoreductase n=1 Tax=Mucilaginibacter psychrotolerans TaxID=1524096 RepID=A0A4Y8SGM3_9SPHI|nr:oxidoreductase [Mucilaginibacter psychrotolerans]TFF37785.1 SDR family NAD(P)-dependent oxidoreductase [Mucilaginibacter psychrotolerans]